MAPNALRKAADNWYGTGNAAITDVATSLVLSGSGAAGLTAPCIIHEYGQSEKILVTAIAEDTPSGGLDTLTITRGIAGTTGAAHGSGATYAQWYYKE